MKKLSFLLQQIIVFLQDRYGVIIQEQGKILKEVAQNKTK